MSTIFWQAFKFSPAILGASLLVASSAYAKEGALEQSVATNNSQVAATVEPTVVPLVAPTQTQALTSSTPIPERVPEKTLGTIKDKSTTIVEKTVNVAPQTPVQETAVSQLTTTNNSPRLNQADSTLAQQVPASGNSNVDSTQVLDQIQQYNNQLVIPAADQVTSVTQLKDVSPGDWAFEALRSLVERYGCIAGYPDGTYRGNRAMSRYEFAAGLNACLNQIERLIGGGGDAVTKKDLETLQRLVDEFRAELTTVGARVDKLEGRVSTLESHQFSTTTKLRGEVIFAFSDLFGNKAASGADYANNETVFQDRVRLNFDTSFTGKDLLRTRLQAANITEFGPLAGGTAAGTNITREGRFGFQADSGNSVVIDRLFYRFPVTDLARVYLFANQGQYEDFVDVMNPGLDPGGTGALSRFGRFNPIYRMGGQGIGVGANIGGGKLPWRLDLGYLTDNGNNPNQGNGLFNGNYSALAQLSFKPIDSFRIAGTYVNSYDNTGNGGNLRHGTGSIASQVSTSSPVVGQSYGVEATYAFSPQLVLSGWGGFTKAVVINTGTADVWNYGATIAINDFGAKGNTLGFVVGMEPRLTGTSNSTVARLIRNGNNNILGVGQRSDVDTGLHVEGFYKFKLTDNILITPGVIWLTSPGHNDNNNDIVIGTIRTTFTF